MLISLDINQIDTLIALLEVEKKNNPMLKEYNNLLQDIQKELLNTKGVNYLWSYYQY